MEEINGIFTSESIVTHSIVMFQPYSANAPLRLRLSFQSFPNVHWCFQLLNNFSHVKRNRLRKTILCRASMDVMFEIVRKQSLPSLSSAV